MIPVAAPEEHPGTQERHIEQPVGIVAAGDTAGVEPDFIAKAAEAFHRVHVACIEVVLRYPNVNGALQFIAFHRVQQLDARQEFADDAGEDAVFRGDLVMRLIADVLNQPVIPAVFFEESAPRVQHGGDIFIRFVGGSQHAAFRRGDFEDIGIPAVAAKNGLTFDFLEAHREVQIDQPLGFRVVKVVDARFVNRCVARR